MYGISPHPFSLYLRNKALLIYLTSPISLHDSTKKQTQLGIFSQIMSANLIHFCITSLRLICDTCISIFFTITHAQRTLHRTLFFEHNQNGLDQNSEVQSHAPLADILCIQFYNILKICDIASTAYLPHSCHTRRIARRAR